MMRPAELPECSNGADDDEDGTTDYPGIMGAFAADPDEQAGDGQRSVTTESMTKTASPIIPTPAALHQDLEAGRWSLRSRLC